MSASRSNVKVWLTVNIPTGRPWWTSGSCPCVTRTSARIFPITAQWLQTKRKQRGEPQHPPFSMDQGQRIVSSGFSHCAWPLRLSCLERNGQRLLPDLNKMQILFAPGFHCCKALKFSTKTPSLVVCLHGTSEHTFPGVSFPLHFRSSRVSPVLVLLQKTELHSQKSLKSLPNI